MQLITETIMTGTLKLNQMELEFLKFLVENENTSCTTGKFRECRDILKQTLKRVKKSGNHTFQDFTPKAPIGPLESVSRTPPPSRSF